LNGLCLPQVRLSQATAALLSSDEPRDWGPLAVVRGDGKGPVMTASLAGALRIGPECVTVKAGVLEYTVVWQQGITRWDAGRNLIVATTEDGADVELKNGDTVAFAGGSGPRPDEWVSPPRASCPKELFAAHRLELPTG
jgi:hypothetical protein